LEGNNYSPICKENVVEMGENFIHSFQRREKLENPEILSTHPKEKEVGKG